MESRSTLAYVVTSGEYSSYRIEGVFTDEPLAEKLRDTLAEAWKELLTPVRVEEYFLNLPVDEFEVTTVRMAKNGDVLEILHSCGRGTAMHCFDACNDMLWSIFGNDEARAVKVANEKRSQFIANNLWGADDYQLEKYA